VQLLRQQDARRQTLARLSREISGQRRTIASLERDDRRLANLVEQLARLLAEQARRAEQSRKAAGGNCTCRSRARSPRGSAPRAAPRRA
jgi:septal ring factor EnvC (AmiA/AmiB activator)